MSGAAARRGGVARLAGALALLLAVALSGGGCAAPKPALVDFSDTRRDYRAKDYEDVYRRWTRHDRTLHQVDTALEVWATFKSWDFREAYVEKYADVYSLAEADRAKLRQAQLEAFHAAYEFHVTAQSTNYKWNDLEKSSSAWRVALVDGLGHELAPERVRIEKLPDAYETIFFPARTAFTRTYSISFAVPAGADNAFAGVRSGSITLRIASPLGHLLMTWQSG